MSLATLDSLVRRLAPDKDRRLDVDAYAAAIDAAVLRYSEDRPRNRMAPAMVIGGSAPLPTDWADGVSVLINIEYPTGQWRPVFLDPETFGLVNTPTTTRVGLPGIADAAEVWLHYTAPHRCDLIECSIPLADVQSVAYLAAATIADQLAASYASDGEPTIMADAVNQSRPAKAWSERATAYRQRYADGIGSGQTQSAPAGAVVSFKAKDSRGRQRLTHPLPIIGGENV